VTSKKYRILMVSYYFPPYNTIGALRVGKMAKYLHRFGHDVRILTASNQPLVSDLPVEIPEQNIIRTKWTNVNLVPELAMGGRSKIAAEGYNTGGKSKFIEGLGKLYKTVVNFPDGQIGWYPYAVTEGRKLLKEWEPDVIYASALPATSLLVAKRLSSVASVKWIAELRDLWVDNHYYEYGPIRRSIESYLEKKVLTSASMLVTVSEPLAEVLERKYGKEAYVIYNGYDEEDIPNLAEGRNTGKIEIIYTGSIIKGKRDPSVLFRAIKEVKGAEEKIQLRFIGKYMREVKLMAEKYGLRNVNVSASVPYRESLLAQQQADYLLLLLWNNPAEKGVYTGKLFEYIGAKKPIIVIGPKDNVAARLVLQEKLGVVITNYEEAKRIVTKIVKGELSINISDEVRNKYTREKQARELERLLAAITEAEKIERAE